MGESLLNMSQQKRIVHIHKYFLHTYIFCTYIYIHTLSIYIYIYIYSPSPPLLRFGRLHNRCIKQAHFHRSCQCFEDLCMSWAVTMHIYTTVRVCFCCEFCCYAAVRRLCIFRFTARCLRVARVGRPRTKKKHRGAFTFLLRGLPEPLTRPNTEQNTEAPFLR